jgi:hypothetical protein
MHETAGSMTSYALTVCLGIEVPRSPPAHDPGQATTMIITAASTNRPRNSRDSTETSLLSDFMFRSTPSASAGCFSRLP